MDASWYNRFKTAVQSVSFKKVLCAVSALLVLLVTFQAGVFVGFRKASFSYRWGDAYHRTFGPLDHEGSWGMDMMKQGEGFTNAHGVAGKVIKVSLPAVLVEGRDGIEKEVLVTEQTTLHEFRQTIKASDLKVGDVAVVVGAPNASGQIEASFIRVMPSSVFSTEEIASTTTRAQ